MKKVIYLALLFVSVLVNSCDNQIKEGCVQVRVVGELCGTAVLQVISGNMDGDLEASWTNNEGETFENVFTTFLDGCDPNYPSDGESFFVEILDERPVSNCAVCLALFANAPEVYYHTKISTNCQVRNTDNL